MFSFAIYLLDLKKCSRKDVELLERLIRVFLINLLRERLYELKLTVGIVKAQVLICQWSYILIEHSYFVCLQKTSIEALSGALRPKDNLSNVRSSCWWLLCHFLFDWFCTFYTFKFKSSLEFFLFSLQFFLFLFLLLLESLFFSFFLSFDLF